MLLLTMALKTTREWSIKLFPFLILFIYYFIGRQRVHVHVYACISLFYKGQQKVSGMIKRYQIFQPQIRISAD